MNNLNYKVIGLLITFSFFSFVGLFFISISNELLLYFIVTYVSSVVSINLGWHRYFSHKSFETNKIVQNLFLFFGSSLFFGRISDWIKEHRDHHLFVYTEKDPQKSLGTFFQRAYWMCFQDQTSNTINNKEFHNSYFKFIDSHSLLSSIISNFILVAIPFLLTPDSLITIIWLIVFARVALIFNMYTLTHACGHNSYLGFLHHFNLGEGNHEYHHKFPKKIDNGYNLTSLVYKIGKRIKVFY